MIKANRHLTIRGLVGLSLVLFAGSALATQVCSENIRSTAPESRFIDNEDGTVTDRFSNLMWKRCSEGQTWNGTTCTGTASTFTWQGALQRAETAATNEDLDFNDWRLPNIKELAFIVERACHDPAINLSVFPATPQRAFYWSASPSTTTGNAWSIGFDDGSDVDGTMGGDPAIAYPVRLVRDPAS